MKNNIGKINCDYLVGRLCLIMNKYIPAHRFCHFNYCQENCGKIGLPGMLSKYNIHVNKLPLPEELKIEYYKKKKKCPGCGPTKNIIKGFGRLVWHRITKGKPEQFIIERAEICNKCEHRTFLNVMEWGIGIVKDKDLPVNHEPGEWDALWCSVCRCFLEAKIRVKEEKCPKNKW